MVVTGNRPVGSVLKRQDACHHEAAHQEDLATRPGKGPGHVLDPFQGGSGQLTQRLPPLAITLGPRGREEREVYEKPRAGKQAICTDRVRDESVFDTRADLKT
jgi:hypothetical protein